MKKPILYTLLAVLLVCFLSACVSDPPEPIPTPSTTAGETAGGSTEPTVDETTAELIPNETTAEETTSEKTAAEETTEEAPVIPGKLEGLRGKWYLSWAPSSGLLNLFLERYNEVMATYSEEQLNLALKVPLTHTSEQNGIRIEANFFQEYYRTGEILQARIKITNCSEEPFSFIDRVSYNFGIRYERNINSSEPIRINDTFLTLKEKTVYEGSTDDLDLQYGYVLNPGESIVFERARSLLGLPQHRNYEAIKIFVGNTEGVKEILIPIELVSLAPEEEETDSEIAIQHPQSRELCFLPIKPYQRLEVPESKEDLVLCVVRDTTNRGRAAYD